MSTISKALPNPPANFSTTLSSGVSDSDLTIPLNSVSGLPTEGVGVIYAKDNEGEAVTGSLEFIHWTNTSGNNLTLSDTGDRGLSGSANGAQSHSSGDTFEVWVHPEYHFYDWATAEHNADGTHSSSIVTLTGTQSLTNKTLTSPVLNSEMTGSGILDEDNMATNSSTKLASQQSIKAYVDGGWNYVTGSWSYASASTITVPSGAASIFQKGDKIRFKQGAGYKYYVLTTVADTLLTVAVTDDYTVANAAITDVYYSREDTPMGFPTFFTFSPTWTGFSSAPTQKLYFSTMGQVCFVTVNASGTSNAAGFDFTLPFTAVAVGSQSINMVGLGIVDNSADQTVGGLIGLAVGGSASATAKVGKTFATRAANAYGGFTTSNTKGVEGKFSYHF